MKETVVRNNNKTVQLQEWFNNHRAKDEMFFKGGFDKQVVFVRDSLAPLVGVGLDYDQRKQVATVISSHTSKSIELPVYQLARPDQDFRIILRDNFHNWKMSVLSETPVQADFSGLFHTTPPVEPDYTGDSLSPVYFEGFPKDLIFGYFAESDGSRWSAEIHGDEALWTSIFLIMRSLDNIKPLTWNTRESHKKELDLARQKSVMANKVSSKD